jgi:hypothetical protein
VSPDHLARGHELCYDICHPSLFLIPFSWTKNNPCRFEGFTAEHFHEHLVQSHSFRCGYRWTKTYLQNSGYIQKAPRRAASESASR